MNAAIILSGGTGSRVGLDIPKQYYEVKGRMILEYGVEKILESACFSGFVIVAEQSYREEITRRISALRKLGDAEFWGFADPGENRQLSIYHGLLSLKEYLSEKDVVLVQDAARPNTSVELLKNCVEAALTHDGALPVLPMKDTVYLSEDGEGISSLLDRSKIFAGQAPEAFRYGKYLTANEDLLPKEILRINGSTEPAILAGMDIAMIPGEERNYKITTREDLRRFEEDLR